MQQLNGKTIHLSVTMIPELLMFMSALKGKSSKTLYI